MLERRKAQCLHCIDRPVTLHTKRVVAAEHNVIGADPVDQETQRLPNIRQAVTIDIAEICAGQLVQTAKRGGLNPVGVIKSPQLVREVAAAMGEHDCKGGMTFTWFQAESR